MLSRLNFALCKAAQRTTTRSITTASLPPIQYLYLPTPLAYAPALNLQLQLVQHLIDHQPPSSTPATDLLLLLQHSPVYTTGRREKDEATLEKERRRLEEVARGAEYVSTRRGGETTHHGPGQLVGYPILDLKRAGMTTRQYVNRLLDFLSLVLRHPSLPEPLQTLPTCTPDLPVGTFLTPTTKIASIGISVRRHVTSHGFALNVEKQIEDGFKKIVACGLEDVQMVSVEGVTGKQVKVEAVVDGAVETFGKAMGREMVPIMGGERTRKCSSGSSRQNENQR